MKLTRDGQRCKTHTTYQMRRQPRSRCEACWFLWRRQQAVYRRLEATIRLVQKRHPKARVIALRVDGIGYNVEKLPEASR